MEKKARKMTSTKSPRAVVLLSGGIDSSTTAALAKNEGYDIYALSFDYNQRHKVELEASKKVALSLKAKKHLIIKFDLREIGGSALTSEMEVPKNRAEEQKSRSKESHSPIHPFTSASGGSPIPITYVPARNTIFLSFALAWAEVLNTGNIFIGANAVDYSGYPDCRPEYLRAFENMANLATKASVERNLKFSINAPLIKLTKAEIIKRGAELGLDYSLTWSCYDPQLRSSEEPKRRRVEAKKSIHPFTHSPIHRFVPCGKCDSCVFRAKGFQEAGIKDI